jgi:hypothetical protein
MTEQEWLACTDTQKMLDFLDDRASQRKFELFTCGCYRSVWHLLTDERFRHKMDVRERYFDGHATLAEFDAALRDAEAVPQHVWSDAWDAIPPLGQVRLVHDIFGNPFRPAALDRSWLTWNDSTVAKMAQAVYDERVFDRLPVLADALEEAGCTNADILNHCRQPGVHVRGCWVLDLLLGKE